MDLMRQGLKHIDRKKLLRAGGIFCLLLLVAGYFYWGHSGVGTKVKAGKGTPSVGSYTVKRGDMMRHIVLSGQTIADANIALAPKYTGRITAVNVKLGDHVKAGDILMVQDQGDLDLSIRQNEAAAQAAGADAVTEEASYNANYLKSQEAYNIDQQKYERNQYLYSIGAISKDTLDSVQETYEASRAAFAALENQNNGAAPASVQSKQFLAQKDVYATDALRKQRDDMILRAPRDGVIGYRAAEVGAIASAGTKVLSLVDNSHSYVDCAISESDAAILSPGMSVALTIDALGTTVSGQLVYVSPAMDDSAKTYTARIALDESPKTIQAGLFAQGEVDIQQRADTLVVPKEAVLTKNGHTTVFVIKEDQTVEEREVTIGLLNDTEEEILSGISDGETVVLSNQDRLKDGMKVDLAEAAS